MRESGPILAIETSLGVASVAVSGAERTPIVMRLKEGEPQAEGLIPLIGAIMERAKLAFRDLAKIAVCVGPGGFSGVRVGVAAARGIGLAAAVPVVGATSIELMVHQIRKMRHGKSFALLLPAGSGLLYGQVFSADGSAKSALSVLEPEEAAALCANSADLAFKPASLDLHGLSFGNCQLSHKNIAPHAEALLELAGQLEPKQNPAAPYYVRPPDAKPQVSFIIDRI